MHHYFLKHPPKEPLRLDSLYQASNSNGRAISLTFIILGTQESFSLKRATLCLSLRDADNIEWNLSEIQYLPDRCATLARSVAKSHQLTTVLSSFVGPVFSQNRFLCQMAFLILLWLCDRNNFHDVIMLLCMYKHGEKCKTINYLDNWILNGWTG